MIKIILITLFVLFAIVLVYAAFKPDAFRVERTVSIKATPEKVFKLINDLHQWEAWSPWEKNDASLKRIYSGAGSGTGAVYEWDGQSQVGQGRMEIIESVPMSRVVLKIDFIKPMEGHNTIEFLIKQQGDVVVLSHAMFGPSPYISKLITLFFSMDKMIGDKFEEGLASIKAIAEK